MSVRTARHLAVCGVLGLALAGCSGAPVSAPASTPTPSAPTQTTTSSVAATPTPSMTVATPSATPTPTSSAAPTLGSVVTPTPTGPATPLAPGLITTNGGLISLSADNAFHADGWTFGQFLPVGATALVPAIAATVNCDGPGPEIEYRLSPTTAKLRVTVVQDILSDSSDNTVNVKIMTDGKTVAEKAISFKQSAELTAPLTGVAVIKLVASPKGDCTTSSNVLITQAEVQG